MLSWTGDQDSGHDDPLVTVDSGLPNVDAGTHSGTDHDSGTMSPGFDSGSLNPDAGPTQWAMVPDFSLEDVNENSGSNGLFVSPRNYLEKVSGWYFGHAT